MGACMFHSSALGIALPQDVTASIVIIKGQVAPRYKRANFRVCMRHGNVRTSTDQVSGVVIDRAGIIRLPASHVIISPARAINVSS
jgi:hypothetical protein